MRTAARRLSAKFGHAGSSLLCLTVLLVSPLAVLTADAQVAAPAMAVRVMGRLVANGENNTQNRPFVLVSQDANFQETITDFQNYCEHQAWEKAVKSLDTIAAGDKGKLVPLDQQLFVPLDAWLRQALFSMPSEGLDAYRLFHDAEARKLLDDAKGDNELKHLETLYARWFATSVGDVASDRLAERYFRDGDMDRAAQIWQNVLLHYPNSSLPRLELLVKSAIAQLRAGHRDAFDRLHDEVRKGYAGQTLVLGGREVEAAAHLASLAEKATAEPGPSAGQSAEDWSLGEDIEMTWQYRYFPERAEKNLMTMARERGFYMLQGYVPSAALHDGRLYLNYIGCSSVLDTQSGKLVSRSEQLLKLLERFQQGQIISPDQFQILTMDDSLWTIAPGKSNPHGGQFYLNRYDYGSAEPRWSSEQIGALKTWSFIGRPVVSGANVLAAAMKTDAGNQLYVCALKADDGSLVWNTPLGTYLNSPRENPYNRAAQPLLCVERDTLYIDTQVGGLVALDTRKGAIRWGLQYDIEAQQNQYYYGNYPSSNVLPSRLITLDGTLYVKPMNSSRLLAIDLAAPALKWQRPVGNLTALLAVDKSQMLLISDEFSAIDPQTQKLLWTSKIPLNSSYAVPQVTRNRIYAFTPRGLFVLDRATGDRVSVIRGNDRDSLGGIILPTSDGLITVSNLCATAYRIKSDRNKPDANKPAASGGNTAGN